MEESKKDYKKDRVPPILEYDGKKFRYKQNKGGLLLYIYEKDWEKGCAIIVKDRKDKRDSARFIVMFYMTASGDWEGNGIIYPIDMRKKSRSCIPIWEDVWF